MSPPEGDDDVLIPEVLDGGTPQPRGRRPPAGRRDRRPFWAMTAGIGAIFMLFFFLPLAPVAALVGIFQGRRLLRELDPNDDADHQARRQAKIGLVAGITAGVLLLVWITYAVFFYEPADKGTGDVGDDKATSQPEG